MPRIQVASSVYLLKCAHFTADWKCTDWQCVCVCVCVCGIQVAAWLPYTNGDRIIQSAINDQVSSRFGVMQRLFLLFVVDDLTIACASNSRCVQSRGNSFVPLLLHRFYFTCFPNVDSVADLCRCVDATFFLSDHRACAVRLCVRNAQSPGARSSDTQILTFQRRSASAFEVVQFACCLSG